MVIEDKRSARRETGNGPRRQLLTRAAKRSTPPPVCKTTKPPTKKLRRKPKKKSQTDSAASVAVDRAGDQLKKRIHLLENHKPAITLTGGDYPNQKFPDDVVVNSMNTIQVCVHSHQGWKSCLCITVNWTSKTPLSYQPCRIASYVRML